VPEKRDKNIEGQCVYLGKTSIKMFMRIDGELYKRVVAAKIFIDESYHRPIDLELIARKALISRFHFHRLFSQVYRQTPHRYLTRIRIARARHLLAENTSSITEICYSIGFESAGSFSLLFKKETGQTPADFRSKAWTKKKEAKDRPEKFVPHCFIDFLHPGNKSNIQ
jgi:AraC-like DNA-binding protein